MFDRIATIIEANEEDLVSLADIASIGDRDFFRGACFDGMDLSGEDLRGFNLTGATFLEAQIDENFHADTAYLPQISKEVRQSSNDRYLCDVVIQPIIECLRGLHQVNRQYIEMVINQEKLRNKGSIIFTYKYDKDYFEEKYRKIITLEFEYIKSTSKKNYLDLIYIEVNNILDNINEFIKYNESHIEINNIHMSNHRFINKNRKINNKNFRNLLNNNIKYTDSIEFDVAIKLKFYRSTIKSCVKSIRNLTSYL